MGRLALGIALATICALLSGLPDDGGVVARAAGAVQVERGIRGCANRNRSVAGIERLQPSAALARAARLHARNMARDSFFDHTDPSDRGPAERVAIFDPAGRFRLIGENIAAGYGSAASTCRAWMGSPGHRANILKPDYTHIGGGFARGGSLGRYYVQVFGTRTAARRSDAGSQARDVTAFQGRSMRIDTQLRERMNGVSWHRGCPVGFGDLRLLVVDHWGFDGREHRGRLVVHRDTAGGMLRAMRTLHRLRFPIRQMRLVDAYGADDRSSMAADNTSAFNCRFVAGSPGVWSQHAYGRAIDVNPIENPYVTGSGYVSPPAGAPFTHRSRHRRGMIHRNGPVVKAFAAIGWEWAGNWPDPKDYQHFSATGR